MASYTEQIEALKKKVEMLRSIIGGLFFLRDRDNEKHEKEKDTLNKRFQFVIGECEDACADHERQMRKHEGTIQSLLASIRLLNLTEEQVQAEGEVRGDLEVKFQKRTSEYTNRTIKYRLITSATATVDEMRSDYEERIEDLNLQIQEISDEKADLQKDHDDVCTIIEAYEIEDMEMFQILIMLEGHRKTVSEQNYEIENLIAQLYETVTE